MTVTRERFEQGLSFDGYKEQMTRNRERFEENERTVTLPEGELAYFRDLPQPLNVLVLAEDWCGDVINNLPVLGRLAAASGKLNLKIFLRDQNLEIMDQYLKEGLHRSIPVFVFFDEDFRELGHWIERPAAIAERQAAMVKELYANDPAFAGLTAGGSLAELPDDARNRLMQAFGSFRAEVRNDSDSEVVRELRELVTRGLAGNA
jgi:hypothetical protein